jgi:hypothetical protein
MQKETAFSINGATTGAATIAVFASDAVFATIVRFFGAL